jgi:hypothetical protein
VIEGYNPKDFEDPPKRESSWVLLWCSSCDLLNCVSCT